jgi:formylglycine-generating enzyme required for sulfatase activity
MQFAQHRRGATYRRDTLPLAEVHAPGGMSPFGLHHMAGNVWQWCRDWYDAGYYARPDSGGKDPLNTQSTKARSERGGSWIGSADLCRSSFRRGRPPEAKGRCLGFRCAAPAV